MLDETEDEYRRLLYVAMTRAADRLIIAGCQPGNRNDMRNNCWYALVMRGWENSGLQMETSETSSGKVTRYARKEDAIPAGDLFAWAAQGGAAGTLSDSPRA